MHARAAPRHSPADPPGVDEKQDDLLSSIAENLSEGIYRSVPGKGLVYANQAFAEMFGYERPAEVLEIDPASLYASPEVRERLRTAAGKTDSFEAVEAEFRRRDGSTFTGLLSGTVIRDDDGDVKYYDGAIADITERKERERKLRHRSDAMEVASDGIAILDSEGRYTYVNQAHVDIYGYDSSEDFLGESWRTCYGDEELRRFEEEIMPILDEEGTWRGEATGQKAGGSFFPQELTLTELDGGGLVCVVRDVTERKESQRELQRVKALNQELVEHAPVGLIRLDEDLRITYENPEAERIFGLPEDEEQSPAIGVDIREFPSVSRAGVVGKFNRLRDGEEISIDLKFESIYGRCAHLRGGGVPLFLDGEFNGAVLMVEDVSEQKERERTLKQERERYMAVVENVHDGILIVQDGTIQYANPRIAEIGGYSTDDVAGRPLEEFLAPESRELVVDRFQRRLQGEAVPSRYEIEILKKEGGRVPVEIQVDTFEYEGEPATVTAARDISEQKEYERALREERDRLETLFENLPTPVVRCKISDDGTPRIANVNAAFETVFGRGAAEVKGENIDALLVPESDRQTAAGITRRALAEGSLQTEVRRKAADGLRDFQLQVTRRTPEEGPPELYVIYTDISRQKERERELAEAKREAEEANRLKSAFLANMSHEIRTPLTSIIGFAEAIGDEVSQMEMNPECPELVSLGRFSDLIHDSGNRLLETLDAVLNLSKLEAGEVEMAEEPLDLAEEAGKVVEQLRPQATESGVGLNLEVDEDYSWAKADEGGAQIALRNLVSNAVKYTEEGGEVWVRVLGADDGAVLEVEDTGIGMDPGRVPKLFEPFRQASEGTDREYDGTGLGLAVTKRAVRQMNGSIEVDTEKGTGSRFTIRLPRANPRGS